MPAKIKAMRLQSYGTKAKWAVKVAHQKIRDRNISNTGTDLHSRQLSSYKIKNHLDRESRGVADVQGIAGKGWIT